MSNFQFGDYCSECDVDENGNLIDEFTTIKGKSFLEYLISKGVDINKKEKEDGWTPLMHLINSYTYNYTKPDLTKVDKGYEYAPLYSAVGNEVLRKEFLLDLELVKMLVEAGADINQHVLQDIWSNRFWKKKSYLKECL